MARLCVEPSSRPKDRRLTGSPASPIPLPPLVQGPGSSRPARNSRTLRHAMAVAVAAAWLPPAAACRSSLSSPGSPFAAPISIHVQRRAPLPCPNTSPLPQRSRLVVASAQFDFARGTVPRVSCFSHLISSLPFPSFTVMMTRT